MPKITIIFLLLSVPIISLLFIYKKKHPKKIKTSDADWLLYIIKYYAENRSFKLTDDANLGLKKTDFESLIVLLSKIKHSKDKKINIADLLDRAGISNFCIAVIKFALKDSNPALKFSDLIKKSKNVLIGNNVSTLRTLSNVHKITKDGDEFTVECT